MSTGAGRWHRGAAGGCPRSPPPVWVRVGCRHGSRVLSRRGVVPLQYACFPLSHPRPGSDPRTCASSAPRRTGAPSARPNPTRHHAGVGGERQLRPLGGHGAHGVEDTARFHLLRNAAAVSEGRGWPSLHLAVPATTSASDIMSRSRPPCQRPPRRRSGPRRVVVRAGVIRFAVPVPTPFSRAQSSGLPQGTSRRRPSL